MARKNQVIVIGAGMAGLAAAHFLRNGGFEVVVVEQDTRPGGRMMSVRKGDDTIDVGAQFIHTNYKVTLELCREFNLESDLVEMRSNDMMMRGGKVYIIPWGSTRIPSISLWSQLKNLRQFRPMIRRRRSLKLDSWRDLLDLDRLELATYARLKLNEELLEYTVRPLMLTYAMAEPEGISLAYYLRSLHMYLTTGAHCFRSGNDVLPKAMARGLDIRYETTVEKILCDRSTGVCGVQTSGGEIEGTTVISAIPSPALLPLHDDWNCLQEEFLREFRYAKMPLVVFDGQVRDAVNYWGGVLDRQAGHRISFLTYPHMKYSGASRPHYLLAWPLGSFGEGLIELSDEEIIAAVTEELREASPADADAIESACVVRHPHTYPQYRVGMFEKLVCFQKSEGRPPGLYFAGDYTEGGLIEGAAQSGYKAARRVMEK
jgi:oxygen-dependent protoporphyrinogen oxidase